MGMRNNVNSMKTVSPQEYAMIHSSPVLICDLRANSCITKVISKAALYRNQRYDSHGINT